MNRLVKSIRNTKDFWTGIIYITVGIGALIIAGDYDLGTARKMGPAYFPSLLSGLLIFIGLISLVRSFLQRGTPISGLTYKGIILVILATVIFGLLVRGAGLIVALPALIIISAYASDQYRWGTSLALAAGLTLFCILVFVKGLGVPLPIIGPWFVK